MSGNVVSYADAILSNIIILDRKHKRANSDSQWEDPFSIDEAKREKARTISIPNGDNNPVYRFLREHNAKELVGMNIYCITDKKDTLSGRIQDVIPPDFIVIRNKGVARMKDCIALGG